MNTALIKQLVCPETNEPLQLVATVQDGDDVQDGQLTVNGKLPFPIKNGVPRFVHQDSIQSQTATSFTEKWRSHAYYREHTARFYTHWFLERYGFADHDALADHLQDAQFILDAGTGSGRDAANFAELTSATVFAVDLTDGAIECARHSVRHDNVSFIQADINKLPFPDGFFDFINCDQVIHHTPDPPAAFTQLGAKLRRGGEICVYVYRHKADVREFVDDHVRAQLQSKSFEEAMACCESITALGRELARINATINIEKDIPLLGIRRGQYDLQRFVHYNLLKCFWNDEFDFFTNNVINADWYHPEQCHRYTPEQFRDWFVENWDILAWDVQEAGISCRARKR